MSSAFLRSRSSFARRGRFRPAFATLRSAGAALLFFAVALFVRRGDPGITWSETGEVVVASRGPASALLGNALLGPLLEDDPPTPPIVPNILCPCSAA